MARDTSLVIDLFNRAPIFKEINTGAQKEFALPEASELFGALNATIFLFGEPRGYYLELFSALFNQFSRQTRKSWLSVCRW